MDRRSFLQLGGAAMLRPGSSPGPQQPSGPAAPFASSAVGVEPGAAHRPNILMIMADQLRQDCVGAYGNRAIRTPHLDRIAHEGVRFNNAYSSVPSCTPARSALMTGMGPWRHGMLGMVNMATRPYPVEKGAAMAAAGYYSAAIGKNHYHPINNPHGYCSMLTDEHCSYWFHNRGKSLKPMSQELRCDYESWFWSQMPDKDPHATGLGWNDHTGKPFVYPEEMHATHWTGQSAERFLQQYDRTEPFFLKVSFIRPHSPYDPPGRLFDEYLHADLPRAQCGEWSRRYEPRSSPRDDMWHGKVSDAEIHRSRAGYFGNVTFVDEWVGRLWAVLESRGLLDNTMIVFFSDHGDMLGDQNMWRKTYAYEQSAKIPMLLRPAASQKIRSAGKVMEQTVELRDMLPTFLDAAGATIPPSIEGKSLLDLVRTDGKGWREWIDLEHNICYDTTNHWNALTDGRWKYILHAPTGEEQLFHLAEDPHELIDLGDSPTHRAQLQRWRERMVEHLGERGPEWVQNGKLMLRKQGHMLGPNFPGYANT